MITVALADDQALVRAGFQLILDVEDGIEVIGEAADGSAAVRLAQERRPDVLLMDIRMPVLDGIQATREITPWGEAQICRPARPLSCPELRRHPYRSAAKAATVGRCLPSSPGSMHGRCR